jgi:hypothetical protein
MDITLGKKTMESLGAKFEELSKKLDKDEKLLLSSVLELAARESSATGANRPGELLRRIKGKFEIGSNSVVM